MSSVTPSRRPLADLFRPQTPPTERRARQESDAQPLNPIRDQVDAQARLQACAGHPAEPLPMRQGSARDMRTLSQRTGARIAQWFRARPTPPSGRITGEGTIEAQSAVPVRPAKSRGVSMQAGDTRTLSRRTGRALATLFRPPAPPVEGTRRDAEEDAAQQVGQGTQSKPAPSLAGEGA